MVTASKKKETVVLRTEDKQKLRGTFYVPKSKKDRAPAALLVHSAGADRSEMKVLAELLQKRGFGVLAIDLRGHGESVNKELDWSTMDEEGRERAWAYALRDIEAGAEWLRGRKDIHTSNLTVVGSGTGCTLAVRHAVNDENARAVVLISPRSEQLGFNVLRDLRDLGGLPTLIVAEKESHDEARRMTEASHKSNGGDEYIEVCYLKCKAEKMLTDKRMKSNVGNWLREQILDEK